MSEAIPKRLETQWEWIVEQLEAWTSPTRVIPAGGAPAFVVWVDSRLSTTLRDWLINWNCDERIHEKLLLQLQLWARAHLQFKQAGLRWMQL